MSARWKSAPLRQLCEFHNGLWTGKKPPFQTARVIRNTNFTTDGKINLTDVAVLQVEQSQFAKRRLRKGDIIIEKSGGGPKQPVGRVVLYDLEADDFSFSNFTSVIRTKDRGALDPDYLHRVLYFWYVSGVTEPLQRRSTGIRNLDFDSYKNLEVPLPPLDEQKRIVAALDRAFAALDRARAKVERNLTDVDAMQIAGLEDQFSGRDEWPSEPLGERVRFIDYRGRTPSKTTSGVTLLTAKNVRMGYIRTEPREFIAEDNYDGWMTRGIPKPGDVLFTTEAPLANVAQLETAGRVALAQRLIAMQPSTAAIDRSFLKWSLMSPQMQADIKDKGTGATVTGIKASLLKMIPLYLPPIEHQPRIAATCESLFSTCRELRKRYRQKLNEVELLRQSLLQAAFSGQLS